MSPSWRTPGIRSFIRLMERRKVLFPHPDGPISAVTFRSGMVSEMSLSARVLPYQNEKYAASTASAGVSSGGLRIGGAWAGGAAARGGAAAGGRRGGWGGGGRPG